MKPDHKIRTFLVACFVCGIVFSLLLNFQREPVSVIVYQPSDYNNNSVRVKYEDSKKPRICSETHHLAFVKVHKCASDTISCILMRFADERNLSSILPADEWNLGWPHQLGEKYYLPLPGSRERFDMIALHALYNRKIFDNLMPADAKYVTVIREPFGQFISAVNYFQLLYHFQRLNITDDFSEALDLFMQDPESWRKKFRISSYYRNFMSFDLGGGKFEDDGESRIDSFVKKIDSEFDLVMISNYFDESLILLRRLMCWPLSSILYRSQNRNTKKPFTVIASHNNSLAKKHKKWSKVDHALFGHFNRTFWKKVSKEVHFDEELKQFRAVNYIVSKVCQNRRAGVDYSSAPIIIIPKSFWNQRIEVTYALCDRLSRSQLPYIHLLKEKYFEEIVRTSAIDEAAIPR